MRYYNNILVFSDLHIPGHHPDYLPFLSAVKEEYGEFDRVVLNGDAVDNHAISSFAMVSEACGDDREIDMCIKELKKLAKLFPIMTYITGNHEERHAKDEGLSGKRFRTVREIYDLPKGWKVLDELYITGKGGDILIKHNIASSNETALKENHCNVVQSHWHSKFELSYKKLSRHETWGAITGCLANIDHPYARYGAKFLRKPVVGCLLIKDGFPMLIKMHTNKNNRWIGKL